MFLSQDRVSKMNPSIHSPILQPPTTFHVPPSTLLPHKVESLPSFSSRTFSKNPPKLHPLQGSIFSPSRRCRLGQCWTPSKLRSFVLFLSHRFRFVRKELSTHKGYIFFHRSSVLIFFMFFCSIEAPLICLKVELFYP